MKNLLLSFSLATVTMVSATAQTPPPQAPQQLQFANLTVRLEDGARRIIQQDINTLVLSNRKYWEAKLDRVVLYFPLIEKILREENVPVDFKYLAVQESSLTPDAVSSSSAVGYWQFKRETAQNHGLRVDEEIDERKSIVASTRAAASYLKTSNGIYNNWMSSLFSYYLGATGISKIVPADWANASEITLTERTDRYLLRFVAHKVALESTLPTYRPAAAVALLEYPGVGGRNVSALAADLGIDEYELRKHNRWVLGDQIPADKEYVLAVPVASQAQLSNLQQKIAQGRPATTGLSTLPSDTGFPVLRKVPAAKGRPDLVLYEINGLPGIMALRGDNAATLARKAKISLSSFLRYNDMSERDPITEGEVYYLAKKMRKATVPFHTVREGETSRQISQIYGLRLKRLLKFNRINRVQKLQAGRVMWLRETRPRNQPVEIITNPAPSVQPTRPVVAQGQAPLPTSDRTANNIPRNASERKVYQPKLVESSGATTPATRSSSPTPSTRPTTPTTSETAPTQYENSPKSVNTGTNTERVVIIRPAGSDSSPVETEIPATGAVSTSRTRQSEVAPTTNTKVAETARSTEPTRVAEAPRKTSTAPTNTAPTRPATPALKHTVEAGQTYFSISKLYGVEIDDLLAWNGLTLNDKLAVGQKLVIKESPLARTPADSKTGNKPAVNEDIIYHTVQKGETMFRISKQYEVTIEQIQQWNELSDIGVKEGQRLKIVKYN